MEQHCAAVEDDDQNGGEVRARATIQFCLKQINGNQSFISITIWHSRRRAFDASVGDWSGLDTLQSSVLLCNSCSCIISALSHRTSGVEFFIEAPCLSWSSTAVLRRICSCRGWPIPTQKDKWISPCTGGICAKGCLWAHWDPLSDVIPAQNTEDEKQQ